MPAIRINPATGKPIALVSARNSRVHRNRSDESGFALKPLFSSYSRLKEKPTIFGESAFSEDDSPVKDDPFSFKEIFASVKEKVSSDDEERETTSGGNGGSILAGIIGGLGSIAGVLPQLGIGSRSRIKEATSIAELDINKQKAYLELEMEKAEIEKDQVKDLRNNLLIGGVVLFVIVVVFVALKS